MSRCIRSIVAVSLAAGVILSCGSERVTQSQVADEQVGQPLSKLAATGHMAQAVVMATLRQDDAPVSNATIELSRSIAGQVPDYAWSGITDDNGQARVEIMSQNVTGYYQARAMKDGNTIGSWSSIPINGGYEVTLDLPIGGKAQVMGSSAIDAPAPPTQFTVRIENISPPVFAYIASGVFAVPLGADSPGPLPPGQSYGFSFEAPPGAKVSFATMFVQSNDLFYAPDEDGIALWDDAGNRTSGDVTDQVMLWDSGTEVNQPIGTGADQAPRQSGANTGAADEDNTVRIAMGDDIPAVDSVIRVTITPSEDSATGFGVQIENVWSGELPQLLAPGVFVVHIGSAFLFSSGFPDTGEGLEALAEDGDPSGLAETVSANTGVVGILAPGVFALHQEAGVLFTSGSPDRGEGLEALAEDGNPSGLAGVLAGNDRVSASGVFAVPEGGDDPGPLLPGGAYVFSFSASAGARLSFATMFVFSNDLFFAPDEEGIPLFGEDGSAIMGDITSMIQLWYAGTEINQPLGVGLDQAPRQSGPNTGAPDPDNTVRIANGDHIPAVNSIIRVTIMPGN
ncbi:MAG: spondin domain-containing protein [Gemmatimonadetes bacterium]|nr:spondin domain-containing protein [Gemmatimonadota bacterium]